MLLLAAINREAADAKLTDCSQRIARAALTWLSVMNAHVHLHVCRDI